MSPRIKREGLSRERILRAALGIVDREGLDALSMRRVGEELSVEAMSLYNHVENKGALLDGVFETILGELPTAALAAEWPANVRERACALRSVLRAHPNALPLFATRPAVTPASLVYVEGALRELRAADFAPREALSAFQVLVAYVVGHTATTCAPVASEPGGRPAYARLDELSFPRVREAARLLPTHDVEVEFGLGLDAMLAGLAPLRNRSARGRPRSASE